MHYPFFSTSKLFATILFVAAFFVATIHPTHAEDLPVIIECPCYSSDLIVIPHATHISITVDGTKSPGEWNEDWAFGRIQSHPKASAARISQLDFGTYWNHETQCHQCFLRTRGGPGTRSVPPIVHSISKDQHIVCLSEILKAVLEVTRSDNNE